jgi:3-oxoacyl-[acyl-carrier protein] reductase
MTALNEWLDLNNRVALVTGGGGGVGFAIADRLAQAGAIVVITECDEAAGSAAADRLTADGWSATSAVVDVGRPAEVAALVADVLREFRRLDVLVNTADVRGRDAPLWEVADADWSAALAGNLTGAFHCCRAAVGHMRRRRSGAIVNLSSVAGRAGAANRTPYAVAHAGLIALTRSLAREVAGDGIRVNAVALPATAAAALPVTAAATDDVAAVVHFLATDDARLVTGQCYDVSSGSTLP